MTRGPVWGAASEDLNATKFVWPAGAARAISDADALARDPVDPLHAVRTVS